MEPSSREIRDQLERILLSQEFLTSERLADFLRFVVEETLAGRAVEINQSTVAVKGLGFATKFDPQTNPAVRMHAHRLRRTLDRYYATPGLEDSIRIVIPKGKYVPVFSPNHGGAQNAASASQSTVSKPATIEPQVALPDGPSIAVLSFSLLGNNEKERYLATGLTDEILIALTQFSPLQVKGPLLPTENKTIDLEKIYRDYMASFVLQGRVRGQGSRIRISTDLTDTSTGSRLWGKTFKYDLEQTSLFDIEDEVTSQVVGVIADGLGIIFQRLQTETYQEHLKLNEVTRAVLTYNYAWMYHRPQDWAVALATINDALEKQPDDALLLALLSNTYYADVLYDLKMVSDSRSEMRRLALKAVSLDPDLQIAQYNLVPQNAFLGWTQQCVEAAHKVVAMNPNHARILAGCATVTTSVGAYELARELIERAKRLNPHYPGWYHFVDYVAYFAHEQYNEAWAEAQKIHIEGLLWHPILRAAILGKLGRVKEAEVHVKELLQIKPDFPNRPREYIRLLFVIDKHVEMILDGLVKAGLEIEA